MGMSIAALAASTLLILSFAAQAAPSGSGDASPRVADPAVWGIYAELVGSSWHKLGSRRETRWGNGDQMIEEDADFGTSVIVPGPTRGTLTLELGGSGLHTFEGTVGPDGSVLWIRKGWLKMPYRVRLERGELVEEHVSLSGREVASVNKTLRYVPLQARASQSDGGRRLDNAPVQAATPLAAVQSSSNVVPPPPPPVPTDPVAIFGPLALLSGQQFAGETSSFKVRLIEDGPTLVMEAASWNSFMLRATGQPGVFSVVAHPNMLHEYHDESTWAATLLSDGAIAIVVKSVGVSGSSHSVTVFRTDGYALTEETWNRHRGSERIISSKYFAAATPALLAAATATAIQRNNERLERKREEQREERQAQRDGQQAVQNYLQRELQTATANAALSASQLNVTINHMQSAQQETTTVAVRPEATKAQVTTPSRLPMNVAAVDNAGGTAPSSVRAAGEPLRFILSISLRAVINGVNATCYSNIVTIDGPPGWPDPQRESGGDLAARALVEKYMPSFSEQCKAYGPLASTVVNFHWNRKGNEHISPESMQRTGQKYRQPVVQL